MEYGWKYFYYLIYIFLTEFEKDLKQFKKHVYSQLEAFQPCLSCLTQYEGDESIHFPSAVPLLSTSTQHKWIKPVFHHQLER